MKVKLHHWIFIGMGGGLLVGLLLWVMELSPERLASITWWLDLFGAKIFTGALKMLVAPLIFTSIVAAVVSLGTPGELGRIGVKALVYYGVTTTVAVTIGLVLVLSIQPGMKGKRQELRSNVEAELAAAGDEFQGKVGKISNAPREPKEILANTIKDILSNPFFALTHSKSLGIIFFSILLGIAITACGEAGQPAAAFFKSLSVAMFKLTTWIMSISPLFIACLIASMVAKNGPEVFLTLGWYALTVILGILLHVVFLLTLVKFVGKKSPMEFLLGIREAWAIAFSTRSSAATLPVTLHCLKKKLGVSEKTSDFVLPLGATVNMDGTALYEGVAVLFLIQLFGGLEGAAGLDPATLGFTTILIIFITAVLASVGAAAVPDAGLVTMVLVATAVGLDVRFLPFIFAIDAFLDMFRTSTNVMGDSIGAVIIDRLEGESPPAAAA
ncbi:MAG: dicarboxylate/amino acid:cation symporter [Acidobacteriota bacterium]